MSPRRYGQAAFLAWLVGVDVSEVRAYREIGDWPSHWVARAQARMSALGVSCMAEAQVIYAREMAA